jgi:hypothetical protein
LVEVEQALTKISKLLKVSVFCRSRTSSDKNLQIVEGDQYIVEIEQAYKLKIFVKACSTSTKN